MNWAEITRALGEINYAGDFTYEVGKGFVQTVDDTFMQIAVNYMGDVGKYLINEIERNRKNFGNGRDVRNLFEKTITKQSKRIFSIKEPTAEEMMLLKCEDIDS